MEAFKAIVLCLWTACVFIIGVTTGINREQKKIDLPEEYKEITPETKIKGKYIKGKDLLIIEFDNDTLR